ncbi:hypothetical protein B0920_13005 [Massilia sp. KIM]|uniref:tetratricopeptide repeat protein n=1 Tax=Massilia sp. KIM TaxID=1955422 RepID=UPI00098FED79|nr:SEL1-like repeat protein [Massilia sp. KIM]OON64204.1 hypothetical protein B0920_13005 [Massilia sp. KIM]
MPYSRALLLSLLLGLVQPVHATVLVSEEDPATMLKRRLAAAEAGDVEAMSGLGRKYLHGYGVEPDHPTALMWLERAVKAGDRSAVTHLAWCLERCRGIERDLVRASQLLRENAARGDGAALASQRLGVARRVADQVRDWSRTSASLEARSAAAPPPQPYGPEAYEPVEEASAQTAPIMALARLDVEELLDVEQAHELLVRCSAQDNEFCMVQLGALHLARAVETPDIRLAAALFERAAARGYAPGQYYLARMLTSGDGLPRDDTRAAALCTLASDAGFAPAEVALVVMLLEGRGKQRDEEQALARADRLTGAGQGPELLEAAAELAGRHPAAAARLEQRVRAARAAF